MFPRSIEGAFEPVIIKQKQTAEGKLEPIITKQKQTAECINIAKCDSFEDVP